MTTPFPVPLDNLIAYVKAQQPQGDPLGELAEAVAVAGRLDEQSDALIGHFVDQARHSGASWSQIGASMGVSKQAAQKRFVPRWDGSDPIPEGQLFSRFTQRARNVLAVAQAIVGSAEVSAGAIVVGLLSEPEGLAAKIMHELGATDEAVSSAFGLSPVVTKPDADPVALRQIGFADDAKSLLRGTLKAVLRLGHNYVGTEHLLLGALFADGPAAATLVRLGVTVEAVEAGITTEIDRMRAERRGPQAG
jgi:ATP-dependent Clp protease ATP-binding subunit ClpA